VQQARQSGRAVSLLVLKTLWPVPERLIQHKSEGIPRIVVPEMNLGQYVHEIERVLPGKDVRFMGRMNGSLIAPQEIEEVLIHG
jgi:2-oxoglutarate ferredoxin oxidoreductase subunit alpha